MLSFRLLTNMFTLFFHLLFLFFISNNFVFGDETSASSEGLSPEEDTSQWEFKTPHGKLSNTFNVFGQRVRGFSTTHNRLDVEVEGGFSLTTPSQKTFTTKFTPWVWGQVPHAVGGLSRKNRVFFELKEGWVEYASSTFDIRVGNQILSWGAADKVNPTDVWNPIDYTDLFQSHKLPILAIVSSIHPAELEKVSLELILTPVFKESRIPLVFPKTGSVPLALSSSRWLLALPSSALSSGIRIPLNYELSTPTYPATWQAGGRFKLMGYQGWDFSLSGYNGVEKIPRIFLTRRGNATDPNLPVTITLNPSFHREMMLGLDGEGDIPESDIGLRFEVAYRMRDNSRLKNESEQVKADLEKDDYFHGVLGGDYTSKGKIFGTVLYTNIMYVLLYKLPKQEKVVGVNTLTGVPAVDPWDRNLVMYIENRFSSDMKLGTTFISSQKNWDFYLNPVFHFQVSDAFHTSLGGEVFFGPSSGFFGQYRDNRRAVFSASYEL